MDIRAVHQNHFGRGICGGGNLHRQLIGPVLALAQSEHVTRNLVNSPYRGAASSSSNLAPGCFCSETTARGLFSVWRPAAYVCHNLLNLSTSGCELSNLWLPHREQRGGSCAPRGCPALLRWIYWTNMV